MSTVDPYTTHHRDETERIPTGSVPDGMAIDDAVIDLTGPHSYTYPSELAAEGVGEPLDLHPYEYEASYEAMPDGSDTPSTNTRGTSTPDERPSVPGPDATTWPPRTPFPDEPLPDRERDDASFVASTRGLGAEASRLLRRLETPETKAFYKTSEFVVFVVASLVLMIAAAASTRFDADQLWPSFTWLVGFYLVSRGLAKAGSRAD